MGQRASDVVPEIVTDDVASLGGIAAHVEGPAVIRLHAGVMNLVVLDDVIVSPKADGLVGTVMDKIVRKEYSYPLQIDVIGMGALAARHMMDVVVDRLVPRLGECASVSAGQRDA